MSSMCDVERCAVGSRPGAMVASLLRCRDCTETRLARSSRKGHMRGAHEVPMAAAWVHPQDDPGRVLGWREDWACATSRTVRGGVAEAPARVAMATRRASEGPTDRAWRARQLPCERPGP